MNYKMKSLLIRWVINTAALFIVVKTIKGFEITMPGWHGLIILFATSAVLGIINVLIKPMIFLLTLPLNLLTFGLFTFIINGAMLYLASFIVKGFEISSFWGAVIGAILYSIITAFFNIIISNEGHVKYRIIE